VLLCQASLFILLLYILRTIENNLRTQEFVFQETGWNMEGNPFGFLAKLSLFGDSSTENGEGSSRKDISFFLL